MVGKERGKLHVGTEGHRGQEEGNEGSDEEGESHPAKLLPPIASPQQGCAPVSSHAAFAKERKITIKGFGNRELRKSGRDVEIHESLIHLSASHRLYGKTTDLSPPKGEQRVTAQGPRG